MIRPEQCYDFLTDVIESKVDSIARQFQMGSSATSIARLTKLQSSRELASNRYDREIDLDSEERGQSSFTCVFDERMDRYIYITPKDVGLNINFHEAVGCDHVLNVIKPNSNHENYVDMTPGRKKWLLDNMR